MVGSFPRSAWQYAPVLQTFLLLFLPSCLIPVLSLSPPLLGLHSHLHIFTGLFPPDFFSLSQLRSSVFGFLLSPYQHIQNCKLLTQFSHLTAIHLDQLSPFLHLAVSHLSSVSSLPVPPRSRIFLLQFLPLKSLSLHLCQLPGPKKCREDFLRSSAQLNQTPSQCSFGSNQMKSRGKRKRGKETDPLA